MEHGVTGFRVAGGDPKALLAAMRQLMDRERRERMGRAAREFALANDVREPYSAILDAEAYRRRRKSEKLLAELLRDGSGRARGMTAGSRSRAPSIARSRATRGSASGSRGCCPTTSTTRASSCARTAAPRTVAALRESGLAQLALRLAEKAPRTLELTEELREGLSDLAFTDAYRVPYPVPRRSCAASCAWARCARHPRACACATSTATGATTSRARTASNVFGLDFYKECIERAARARARSRARARALPPRDPRQRPPAAGDLRARRGLVPHVGHRGGDAGRRARALPHRAAAIWCASAAPITAGGTACQPGVGNPRDVRDVYTLAEQQRGHAARARDAPRHRLRARESAPGAAPELAGARRRHARELAGAARTTTRPPTRRGSRACATSARGAGSR